MECLSILSPVSISEVNECVKWASADGRAVYPRGGGTQFRYGYPIESAGIILELNKLQQVIDYPARDMTITVQAGLTLSSLAELLRREGQELPVDVPLSKEATIGGAIASNASGPRRFGWGTLRDYLIGVSLVNDQGVEVKGGGRVVKNVAGYDIMKLMTNSWGTLGIITQVTLKVRPLAEKREAIRIPISLKDLPTLWDLGRTTRTRPVAMEVYSPSIPVQAQEGRWKFWIAFEDNAQSVCWQRETFLKELPDSLRTAAEVISGSEYQKDLTELTDYPHLKEHQSTLKINDRPSRLPELLISIANNLPCEILGRLGSGILYVVVKPEHAKQIGKFQEQILQRISPEGNCVILNCPEELKPSLPLWGRTKGDFELMRAVKKALDPKGLFNPKRYLGQI